MLRILQNNNSDIIQVTSTDINFNAAGWFASMSILENKAPYSGYISKAMTKSDDGLSFQAQLSPIETGSIPIGKYKIAIKVENNSLNFRRESFDIVEIKENPNAEN